MPALSYAKVQLVRRRPVFVEILRAIATWVLAYLVSAAVVWWLAVRLFSHSAQLLVLLAGYGLVLAALVRVAEGGRVTLGADGIRAVRPFRRARFIPYRSIARVVPSVYWLRPCVTLVLRDGDALELVWGGRRRDRTSERDEAARRLEADVRAAESGVSPAAEALFARSGPVADWIHRVRSVPRDASYRAVTPEMLWELVENPAAAASARAGAAAALARSLDEEGRARIRVAAEACAEPRLRVALEAATTEDDEALEEALARLP